jgi:cell wall-associated NlpC family hydrolase
LYDIAFEVGRAKKLETLKQIAPGADCVINWNVFDWGNGKDGYGRRKSDGVVYEAYNSKDFPTWNITDGIMSMGNNDKSILESSYWRTLIVNGKLQISNPPGDNGHIKDARNAIAQFTNTDVMFVAVEGDDTKRKGMTDKELAGWLYSLGAVEAYTNDGGGSVAMYTKDGYKYNQGRAIAGVLIATRKTFTELIKAKVGCGYAWGTQGEILTATKLAELRRIHGPSKYDFEENGIKVSANKWLGKQCFDCSGLIVWALKKLGFITQDYTAAGLYGLCDSVDHPQPGDLCFNVTLGHVGVYAGGGQYVHSKGTNWGVVMTDKYNFVKFGRLKSEEVKSGMNDYWSEKAVDFVKYFQKEAGLVMDGKAGTKTLSRAKELLENEDGSKSIKEAWKKFKEVVER